MVIDHISYGKQNVEDMGKLNVRMIPVESKIWRERRSSNERVEALFKQ